MHTCRNKHPEIIFSDEEIVYLTLKHRYPDLIRKIRLALDNGITPEEAFKSKPLTLIAIKYMRENPLTGACKKWDGQIYQFEE